MLTVEVRQRVERDEELRRVGVRARVRVTVRVRVRARVRVRIRARVRLRVSGRASSVMKNCDEI